MSVLTIRLLGSFQVNLADQPVEPFDTIKTKSLLAYLAMEGSSPVTRDLLAGLFWPDFPNPIALRNLRLSLFHLRQVLGAGLDQASRLAVFPVTATRQAVQFNRDAPSWVDALEFETLIAQSKKHLHHNLSDCPFCVEKLEKAVALYRGDLLEGFVLKDSSAFMEWLLLSRAHFQQLVLDALDQLGNYYLRQAERADSNENRGRALEASLSFSRCAIQIDPVRETAYIQLMKVLAALGKKQEALSQFKLCERIMADEFGAKLEGEIISLYGQICADTYRLRPLSDGFPPAASRARHNLPAQLTPLIGRESQIDRLVRLLFSYRWVTLVGEGGIGKSRLAVTAAERVIDQFPDGILFLPLEALGATELRQDGPYEEQKRISQQGLVKAVAAACELPMMSDPVDTHMLFEYLAERKMLLILDSFEHFSNGADFLLELLTHTRHLHILVTTRQSLYFQAGCLMRIDGLPVPEDDLDPKGEQYPAVQLFVERVARLYGEFHFSPENMPWVYRICRLLDGIPLAIELAAPWVTRLPLEGIAHAIEQDLDFLSTAMPGLLERHHSMRAVFESSWMLLNSREKKVLSSCAAFTQAFRYDEVFESCSASFQELEGLVDKNLVIKLQPKLYRLHETLRQYVAEKSLEMGRREKELTTPLNLPLFSLEARI